MDLEVSTWTRRERLERIASAERDRRAGRGELAIATLGEGTEWPARVVLALIRLPEGEGAEARAVLEETLDAWAADSGLDPLDAVESLAGGPEDTEADKAPDKAPDEATSSDDVAAAAPTQALDTPIAIDELDRAFAEAEAQTDEMLDVNTVAARVLMEEPMGLAEIDDDGPSEPMPGEPIETDAAWVVPASAMDFDVAPEAPFGTEATDASEGDAAGMDAAVVEEHTGAPPRRQVIETLERWLSNLERGRSTRNAQQHRGA